MTSTVLRSWVCQWTIGPLAKTTQFLSYNKRDTGSNNVISFVIQQKNFFFWVEDLKYISNPHYMSFQAGQYYRPLLLGGTLFLKGNWDLRKLFPSFFLHMNQTKLNDGLNQIDKDKSQIHIEWRCQKFNLGRDKSKSQPLLTKEEFRNFDKFVTHLNYNINLKIQLITLFKKNNYMNPYKAHNGTRNTPCNVDLANEIIK